MSGKRADSLRAKASAAEVQSLESRHGELIDGNQRLLEENQKLLNRVGEYQADLEERDGTIAVLQREASLARRGAAVSYDFNGARREVAGPGRLNLVEDTPESQVFQRLVELEKLRQHETLVPVCLEWIERNPDWLAPSLFLGVAYANTGRKQEAIELLEHVVASAPNDPEYGQATEMLRKLRESP